MKIVCAPTAASSVGSVDTDLRVVLYGRADTQDKAEIGATAKDVILHKKLRADAKAWDLLSIALSVVATDYAAHRDRSPDGWTRELDVTIAVADPAFWTSQKALLEAQLRFLTTDIWRLTFVGNGFLPKPPKPAAVLTEDCVSLLSGGLDSLVGAIDLVRSKKKPLLVSQVAQGDKEKQGYFSNQLGKLYHLQLNHNVSCPGDHENSQRARSFIFFAYGVLAATSLKRYHDGEPVTLFVCENGLISINPPLTTERMGSLSTRTTHPHYLRLFQTLLTNAGLRVEIKNPYQFKTKGEMLTGCADQALLTKLAHHSTSCGRFGRFGYKHCGRCVPCLIRRASFHKWGVTDQTAYYYDDLSRDDDEHARFDDVRSAAMAVAGIAADGVSTWAASALSTALLGDTIPYEQTLKNGIDELGQYLKSIGVS